MKRRPRIGFHAPIAGGLQNALLKARRLGADAVQIFSRNPRGWAARPLTDEEIELFKRTREETGIGPVLIHANYLINLAAADPVIREKSIASFREEVGRGLALGADYLVVHPGSARGACESDAVRACAESLSEACDGLALGRFRVLLENTAGQGECIGHRFEHLGEVAGRCPDLGLGVCLDTAHAFTAGYDIRDEDGLEATFDAIERNVGMEQVRAVHFNDSRAAYNSRVDRHWHIGLGHIGAEALRRVARSPRLAHAAFLLETPQDEHGDDARNLAALRKFVGYNTRARIAHIEGGERMAGKKGTIVIDPGHGGTVEVGGSSHNNARTPSGILEKNMTLRMALLVRDALQQAATIGGHTINVLLTRDTDKNLGLADRARVAQRNNADLFLSLHFNASERHNARGVETLVDRRNRNTNHAADTAFARLIQAAVFNAIKAHDTKTRDRGVKDQGLMVLNELHLGKKVRGCLCEIEFIDVAAVDALLNLNADAPQVRQDIATAIANALVAAL